MAETVTPARSRVAWVVEPENACGERHDDHQAGDKPKRRGQGRDGRETTDDAGGDEAAAVGDAGDARDASRRVWADPAGCREHKRDDEGDANAEQRERGQPDREIGRQDDQHGPGRGACSGERTVRTGPSFRITESPTSRAAAIVAAYAETASAAALAEPPSSFWR